MTFAAAAAAGLVCGVLSGFGIGGGSLLMVWMTAVLSMEQKAAQGVNLLYFLPCAACALIFHIKNRQIVWRAVWPAALAGSVCAVGGAMLAQNVDAELLRKLFGGFLVLVGLSEILLKGLHVDTLYLIGGLTDVCIHYTAVDAHQHDYFIRVVTDAVAGSSEEAHRYALKAVQYLQRDALVTTADVESALE